jgi:uncharacterized Tic20 family protein
MSQNLEKNRILSALCHGSIFFTSVLVGIAIPIIILVLNDDQVVQSNAKESLNFQLNVWIYGFITAILCFVIIGWFLLPLVILMSIIFPIIAIVKTLGNPHKVYRYPFILRLL